jgi:glycosyltransferase involved in cell wall biosynthesis
MTRASIIICTQNRADNLRRTLAAMAGISVPAGMSVEMIIVDNGSTDETAAVVRDCALANMTVKYALEEHKGKSWALNRGLAEADADILVFTDDDVIPAQDWLTRLCAPIIGGAADAVVGSVKMAPHLDRPWMTETHRAWLADTDGLDARNPERLVGANMAFSRSVLEKIPAFDIELGPGALGFGEETLLSEQMRLAGYRIFAAFDAKVEHHFDENRLEPARWADAAKKRGRIDAYMAHHWAHDTWPNPRWLACVASLQYLRHYLPYSINKPKSGAMPLSLLNATRHLHAAIHYLEVRKKPRNYEKYGLVRRSAAGSDTGRVAKGNPAIAASYPAREGSKV